MSQLEGRVALITGASRGIGRAIALTLAARGAVVVAAARGDHAGPVVEEIRTAGGQAEAAAVDVTDAGAIDAAVAAILAKHGRIDILVNNAGITRDQLLLRLKRADWDAVEGGPFVAKGKAADLARAAAATPRRAESKVVMRPDHALGKFHRVAAAFPFWIDVERVRPSVHHEVVEIEL